MATPNQIVAAVAAAKQELTLALAHMNFDFSLVKLAPPPSFEGLGNVLSPKRRISAESGSSHVTARKLGALFEHQIPSTPRLVEQYGMRASEIAQHTDKNEAPSHLHGIFAEQAGIDGTSIWAAATSGQGAVAVHLLACMLARMWSGSQATSIWAELVQEQKRMLSDIDPHDPLQQRKFQAAQVTITRDQLAEWDNSARAWLRVADETMKVKQTQLMLVFKNICVPVNPEKGNLYTSVTAAWTQALRVMEHLLNGAAQRITHTETHGDLLLALSSWHIYPDLDVLGRHVVKQDDPLVPSQAILTIGLENSPAQQDLGPFWSLPLAHYRFYGPPVISKRSLCTDIERVSSEQLLQVALGSVISAWEDQDAEIMGNVKLISNIYQYLIEALGDNDDSEWSQRLNYLQQEPNWIRLLAEAAQTTITSEDHERTVFSRLVGVGKRRGKGLLPYSTPIFGLATFTDFVYLLKDTEQIISAMRRFAARWDNTTSDLVIRYRNPDFNSDGTRVQKSFFDRRDLPRPPRVPSISRRLWTSDQGDVSETGEKDIDTTSEGWPASGFFESTDPAVSGLFGGAVFLPPFDSAENMQYSSDEAPNSLHSPHSPTSISTGHGILDHAGTTQIQTQAEEANSISAQSEGTDSGQQSPPQKSDSPPEIEVVSNAIQLESDQTQAWNNDFISKERDLATSGLEKMDPAHSKWTAADPSHTWSTAADSVDPKFVPFDEFLIKELRGGYQEEHHTLNRIQIEQRYLTVEDEYFCYASATPDNRSATKRTWDGQIIPERHRRWRCHHASGSPWIIPDETTADILDLGVTRSRQTTVTINDEEYRLIAGDANQCGLFIKESAVESADIDRTNSTILGLSKKANRVTADDINWAISSKAFDACHLLDFIASGILRDRIHESSSRELSAYRCSLRALIAAAEILRQVPKATFSLKTMFGPLLGQNWVKEAILGTRTISSKSKGYPDVWTVKVSEFPIPGVGTPGASSSELIDVLSAYLSPLDLDRGCVFAMLAAFESGTLNPDPAALAEVMAMSSGDSLFVAPPLLSDPGDTRNTDPSSICWIRGNVGKPGIAMLIPPADPEVKKREQAHWSFINHAPFDGQYQDNFQGTSAHLSFTEYSQPIYTGSHGARDSEIYFLEALVSVYSQEKWIGDLDVLGALNSRFFKTMVHDGKCSHHAPQVRNFHLISIDNWDEFIDHPTSVFIVRAKGNWLARLAAAFLSAQRQHMTLVVSLADGAGICWPCVRDEHELGPKTKDFAIIC